MDKRQLQIFHAVAEQASFTKAARELHMAQPAVSIAVRKLEDEFGVQLLNRDEKAITLTAEGRTLFQHAERILNQFQQAKLEMAELQGMERGEVRLGTSAMMGTYFFPEKIARFRQRYPKIKVQVSGEGTQRSQQLILDGDIDMGVVNMDGILPELEAHSLVEKEEVVACVLPEHPFAGRKSVSFADFAREDLIVYREGYYLREIISSLSQQFNVEPSIAIETNLLRLMITLVRQGQGVGFCLKRVTEQEEGITGISFKDPIFLNLGIAWRRGHYLSKANKAFIDFLLSEDENCAGG